MENKEKIFPNGAIVKPPHANAPEWVKGKISIKVEDFVAFLNQHQDKGWVNLELKESKKGGLYLELDQWKPDGSMAKISTTTEETKENSDEIDASSVPF